MWYTHDNLSARVAVKRSEVKVSGMGSALSADNAGFRHKLNKLILGPYNSQGPHEIPDFFAFKFLGGFYVYCSF